MLSSRQKPPKGLVGPEDPLPDNQLQFLWCPLGPSASYALVLSEDWHLPAGPGTPD